MIKEDEAADLAARALGAKPLHAVPQLLTRSGKNVYRLEMPDGSLAVLRISDRPGTFAFTRHNLDALRALELPVQSVVAVGATAIGGCYIILSWMAGTDLVYALTGMSSAQMTGLAERVVQAQRRVSKLRKSKGFGWAPVGRDAPLHSWTEVFGKCASGSLLDDGTRLGRCRARLAAIRAGLEPYFQTVPARPFLDDLTIKNVLVENGELSGIIDVDFVCYGDPLLSVGATIAAIAADVGPAGVFYGEELLRLWEPAPDENRAALFYAALWAIGLVSAAEIDGQKSRAATLMPIADSLLRDAEAA